MIKSKKDKLQLTVFARDIFGKKLKSLRKEQKIPANIYGEEFKSQAIWIPKLDFMKTYKLAGETQVVYLDLDKTELPTLIDMVQKHPISNDILHIDFKKVSLKKKIETSVPVLFVGESEAVEKKKGDMMTVKDEVMVRALPDAIPSQIEIDISVLIEVDDEIKIENIAPIQDVEFIDPIDSVIVRINEHKEESVEPETTAETPEITEEKEGEEVEETEGENSSSEEKTGEEPQDAKE